MTEKKKKNTKNLAILSGVIVLIIIGLVLTSNKSMFGKKTLSPAEAKARAESFIKDFLVSSDTVFSLAEPIDYNEGLYEIEVTLQDSGQPIKSYMTKDGKLFIPQAMDIDEVSGVSGGSGTAGANTESAPVAQAPKSDKPKVEIFVMSHCPFGTQIEKGILPVAKALGSKIDFQLKFVNYAMHGQKEIDEQLAQYCISKEQNNKLYTYLDCFLQAGDSATCLNEAKIDQKKMAACVSSTDKQFKINEIFAKGQSAWGSSYPPFPIHDSENKAYGVQGSPSLVINGQQIESSRDAASLAKVICGAFNDGKRPAECDATFASATPAPGFGTGTQAAGAAAAECAP